MTLVPGVVPGRPVRNGLPGWKPYVYRGTGYDQLTPHLSDAPVTPPDYPDPAPEPVVIAKRRHGRGICNTCGYGTRGANHRALCGGAA